MNLRIEINKMKIVYFFFCIHFSNFAFTQTATFDNDRNYFIDQENAGRVRVGAAWGIPGLFAEDGKNLVLGVQSSQSVYLGMNGNFMTVLGNGNVGVGTESPASKLDVRGNISLGWRGYDSTLLENDDRGFLFFSRGANGSVTDYLHDSGRIYGSNTLYDDTGTGGGWQNQALVLQAANSWGQFVPWQLVLKGDGNVGIGTTNTSGSKLSVAGIIRAQEVIVETGWADYVFAEGYKLAPLDEVEAHINERGHLPGVPSAEDVQGKGLSLGDSQTLMMAKIEELTLYIIEQNKRIAALEGKLNEN